MANREEVAEIMAVLAAAFPTFDLQAQTIEVYYATLKDLDGAMLKAAAHACLTASEFFPTVHRLREAVAGIQSKITGMLMPEEAWEEVRREMRKGGIYHQPEFSSPLVRRAVDSVGGWYNLCGSENVPADRAHFLRIYETFMKREQENATMAPFVRQLVDQERKKLLTSVDQTPAPESNPVHLKNVVGSLVDKTRVRTIYRDGKPTYSTKAEDTGKS